MAELKTKATATDPLTFLNAIEPESKKADGMKLLEIFKRITGQEPVLWGSSIVGFGKYHYKSERSSQEGDWPLVGFSPRKQNLSLYVLVGSEEQTALLSTIGKHKASVGCLYLNKLADVDLSVLEKLIKTSYEHMKRKHNAT